MGLRSRIKEKPDKYMIFRTNLMNGNFAQRQSAKNSEIIEDMFQKESPRIIKKKE